MKAKEVVPKTNSSEPETPGRNGIDNKPADNSRRSFMGKMSDTIMVRARGTEI